MRQIIAPALVVGLMAAACHPHADVASGSGVSLIAPTTHPLAPLTGVAAGSAIAVFLHPDTIRVLDRSDRPHLERALIRAHNAFPGARIEWKNPETGNSGTVMPTGTGHTPEGLPCREMRQDIHAGGQEHHTYLRACQLVDGTWARMGA